MEVDPDAGEDIDRVAFELRWDEQASDQIKHYKVYQKKLLMWELIDQTDTPAFVLKKNKIKKKWTVCVTAVDYDDIESARSKSVNLIREVEPNTAFLSHVSPRILP